MKCTILLLYVAVASGLTVPQSWRQKRDTSVQDQQTDSSLLLYSAAPSSVAVSSLDISPIAVSNVGVNNLALSAIHSPFLWRKKRDTNSQDQQADSAMLMLSAAPATISSLGISPISAANLGISTIHSPFLWRKKRDTNSQDQQADSSLLMYSMMPTVDASGVGLKTIPVTTVGVNPIGFPAVHSPIILRKKRDTADQQGEDSTILYTVPMSLTANIWGNPALKIVPLKD